MKQNPLNAKITVKQAGAELCQAQVKLGLANITAPSKINEVVFPVLEK